MTKKEQRSRKAWRKWERLVGEQKRSRQSVAGFCRERGLCAPQFHVWKKRLREVEGAKFVAVQVVAGPEPGAPNPPLAGIEVRLSQGRSLVVGPGFEASHLRALLAVLETVG